MFFKGFKGKIRESNKTTHKIEKEPKKIFSGSFRILKVCVKDVVIYCINTFLTATLLFSFTVIMYTPLAKFWLATCTPTML